MDELYAVLGIARDATGVEVRKAYRKASKKAHPDGGGSEREFHRVAQALSVLSDPKRRKVYDETGKIEDAPVDNEQSEILGLVSALMNAVFAECDQTGAQWHCVDMVQRMLRAADHRLAEAEKHRASLQDIIGRQKKLLKRFVPKKGRVNQMENLLNGNIVFLEGQRQTILRQMDRLRKAKELVQQYRFEPDNAPQRFAQTIVWRF